MCLHYALGFELTEEHVWRVVQLGRGLGVCCLLEITSIESLQQLLFFLNNELKLFSKQFQF